MKRGRPKVKLTEEQLREKRRAYQRKWYADHRESAREYQRLYASQHRKPTALHSTWGRSARFVMPREKKITATNASVIMQAPVEKSLKLLTGIIRGEITFSI